MYCDENCRDIDWSTIHKDYCNKKVHHDFVLLGPIELLKAEKPELVLVPQGYATLALMAHLIAIVGMENIRKIALENKPMNSMSGDPKKRGFQDGKFQVATLAALLSLEDDFENLSLKDLESFTHVSI